jgi:hypothetical protein
MIQAACLSVTLRRRMVRRAAARNPTACCAESTSTSSLPSTHESQGLRRISTCGRKLWRGRWCEGGQSSRAHGWVRSARRRCLATHLRLLPEREAVAQRAGAVTAAAAASVWQHCHRCCWLACACSCCCWQCGPACCGKAHAGGQVPVLEQQRLEASWQEPVGWWDAKRGTHQTSCCSLSKPGCVRSSANQPWSATPRPKAPLTGWG